ncbi:hypothetical protein M9H77_16775 [Catharanthus roseus]|uniref:Uncharacterized protein n=1 Tax=Catharanthus roseus TaxID=4058 RepID=A0ACC0B2W4_CATRO|nr:hypothetical protein M9H77_16775 [Catharanthus roseus]
MDTMLRHRNQGLTGQECESRKLSVGLVYTNVAKNDAEIISPSVKTNGESNSSSAPVSIDIGNEFMGACPRNSSTWEVGRRCEQKRRHSVQIILSQEKNIQKLNELVRSLREQLRQCMINNETTNNNLNALAENVIELERQEILED